MTSPRSKDAWAGCAVLILAAGVVFAVRQFPPAPPGVPGPTAFPLVLAAFGGLLGCALLGRAARGLDGRAESAPPRSAGVPPWRVPAVLAATAAYAVLMPLVGFISGSTVFLAAAMLLFGYARKVRAVAISLAMAWAVYLLFAEMMNVPLPGGWLG